MGELSQLPNIGKVVVEKKALEKLKKEFERRG